LRRYLAVVEECLKVSICDFKKQMLSAIDRVLVSTVSEGRSISLGEVHLAYTRTCFNGLRVWFQCPYCQRRVRELYLTRERFILRCRDCHGLLYSSQKYHRKWRYEAIEKYDLRQSRIAERLGNKYLRKPTKIKLINEFECLRQQAFAKIVNYVIKKFRKHQ